MSVPHPISNREQVVDTMIVPIAELPEAEKAEVASAIAGIGDEDLACPVEGWRGRRFRQNATAVS